MDERPEHDKAPEQIQDKERRFRRGRLKIFFGYASGVGKTYAMLEAALQQLGKGLDVVSMGETPGPTKTENLLARLEKLSGPMRDTAAMPLELDAAQERRPDLVLVDNLAHTNPPGSRHARRYQDVLELLDSGINVYTTLNVQHLESLNDVVAQITGVAVHETLPDRIFDEADEIELVDLPVDELLQRLEEGQVHLDEQTPATHQFFRRGNLSALRELTYRRAADRIDEQMRDYMQSHGIAGPWPATERVLVCVGPSPLSARLVRAGRRLAARLNAEWFAVYVETPRHASLSDAERQRLAHTLRLAEELGARSITLPGRSVAEAVSAFARARNVTKIVAGKPVHSRWREWLTGTLVDQIIRHSQDIDVYVISGKETADDAQPLVRPSTRGWPWRSYALALALALLITVLAIPLRPFIEPTNLAMLYLLAVVVSALWLGRRPAILTSLLSVVAFDVIFVPPYYTLVVTDAEYIITFAALFIAGVVISTLAARVRQQVRAGQRREAHMLVLYELSRDLAGAANVERVAQVVVQHVEESLDMRAVVLMQQAERLERIHGSAEFKLDDGEYGVAGWTFVHRVNAGRYTESFSEARGLYLPLKTAQDVVGVLGVAPVDERDENRDRPAPAEQRRLLESFASQAAVAIERSLLVEEARQAHLLQETEKLQTALLNSISHDLRTPLASITGALSSLYDDAGVLNEGAREELIYNAYEEAERLNRLVGNLLKMTQLESGALRISKELHDLEDVVGVVLTQLQRRLRNREVQLEIAEELPLAPMDFVLMAQALVNLLENAHKYSTPGRPLTIRAYEKELALVVEIMDRGPGIPDVDKERVFEKFYRIQGMDEVGGTGLGLSISRGIVEAHGGWLWVEDRQGGGSIFTVSLPLHEEPERRREPVT